MYGAIISNSPQISEPAQTLIYIQRGEINVLSGRLKYKRNSCAIYIRERLEKPPSTTF
jgi:hypothetical protein